MTGEALVVLLLPRQTAGHAGERVAAHHADHILECGGLVSHYRQALGTLGVTAQKFDLIHGQLRHLAQDGACLCIEPRKEDRIGLMTLDGSEGGRELRRLVAGVLLIHDLHIALGSGRFKQLDDALSIGSAIINDGYALDTLMLDGVIQQGVDHSSVASDDTEGIVITHVSNGGVGGCGRDVGDAAFVVNLGCRQRGAGLQVANHCGHLLVAEHACQ